MCLIVLSFIAPPASALFVKIEANRIWIEADGVPLQNILRRVADHGVRVKIDPQLNPDITVAIENQEIQAGISIILKSVNHVLVWQTHSAAAGPVSRLAEIQIFDPGKKSRMIDLPRINTFEILKDPKDGTLYVKDEILVRLEPEADFSGLARLLEKINATVLERNAVSGVYRVRLPENSDVSSIRQKIDAAEGVSRAEPNYAYPLPLPAQIPGLTDPENETPKLDPGDGKPPIAILDSGIAPHTGIEDLVVGALNAVDPSDSANDSLGHGTQMAYVASGVIKPQGVDARAGGRVPILPVKVFDENGYTSNFSILQSIQFAIENGATVISLSWGSETRSRFLEETLQAAEAKGLIVIASAGNTPTGKPVYPAAYDSVIGVGALTPDGRVWENSNFGDFVTLYAPGFGNFPVGYKGNPGSYAGTSISAAFTANVIADYLLKYPDAGKEEVLKMLSERTQRPSGPPTSTEKQ